MTIRTKLLGVTVMLCAIFCLGMYLSVKHIVNEIVHELLWKYSEVTTQYDSEKALSQLSQQIEIARKMAQSEEVQDWALDASNPQKQRRAQQWLRSQRELFFEDNYYIVLNENLSFYMSSKDDTKNQPYFRYHLSPDNPNQSWYFTQRVNHELLGATVDYDNNLHEVKLWVSQPILHNGEFLGLLGTSLDLGPLVPKLVGKQYPGLTTIFVNHTGNIELDPSFTSGEFVNHLKNLKDKKSLHQIIQDEKSYDTVMGAMNQQGNGQETQAIVVNLEPDDTFVSIKHIPDLGWYQIKFVDVDKVLDGNYLKSFSEISFAMFLLFTMLLYTFVSRRFFLPMSEMYRQLKRMLPDVQAPHKRDMIDDITHQLDCLDRELFRSRHSLDSLVRERTETLDQLAMIDPLTGLLNRSGMERELNAELARAKRENGHFGLVWLSIDGMEDVEIMDISSHLEQDKRLRFASEALKKVMREYDCACRWADGEFVILIRSNSVTALSALTERLRSEIHFSKDMYGLSFALGGLVVEPTMTMQDALSKADSALYLAKTKTEERVHIIQPGATHHRLRA